MDTGQRALDSGMGGLMDYKTRFYSPLLGRFIQPDSLIPNASNPQAWNRYSYVKNNPVNLNDPSGHKACDDEDDSGCYDAEKVLNTKNDLEKKYKIKVSGKWNEREINSLRSTLSKLVAARWNPNGNPPSTAAWCGKNSKESCSLNTIVFADDMFLKEYQFDVPNDNMQGAKYPRSFTANLDTAIQFTMAHEFGHVLSDANPSALGTYSTVWGGDDEAMANEIALQAITGNGSQFAGWAFDYGFWNYTK